MEKRMLKNACLLRQANGTKVYSAKWQGNFSDFELITLCDNEAIGEIPTEFNLTPYHYGGYVDRHTDTTGYVFVRK